jgi:hypothetical protein
VPTAREWPVADRVAAARRLQERGILTADGAITSAGMVLHLEIELATDRAAALPAHRFTEDADRLAALLAHPVARLRDTGDVAAVAALRNEDR